MGVLADGGVDCSAFCVCVSLSGNQLGAEGGASLAAALRAHPGQLKVLEGVELREVDPDLPLELKGARNDVILGYYRDLSAGPAIISRRCRVMFLGNGGVGKTTLGRRLVAGRPFATETETTHGVLQRKSWACIADQYVHLGFS